MTNQQKHIGLFSIPVIVAALGYFVDIYDLLLFAIIRVPSLKSLGLTQEQILTNGENILQIQMIGLLIGGILAGVIADKKGRLSVLFGSILLYSLANIANGFVQTVNQYALVRFIAGIGLAGELGVGITLVSEMLPKEKRGIATSLVAGIGLTGAVVAFFFKQMFDWRTCYFIGGGLGFLLLLLRVSVYESGMFHAVKKDSSIKKGNFFMLFTKWERTKRYLLGIFIGLPTWYVIGVLITFSNDFGKAFNIKEPIDSGKAVMFAYAAISIGDVLIGFISQWLKSRKTALYIFYFFTAVFITLFFTALQNGSAASLYIICAGMGFGTGFWAIFVTMGAEQFGTNIRATAATTIPNMVRGLLAIFILPMFKFFRAETSFVTGAIITGVVVMIMAIVSSIYIKETFGKDLNYVEE
jgi:MFS family permease